VNWTRDQWQTLVLNKTAISEEEFLTLKVTESMIERSGIDKKKKVLAIHGEVKFILKW